jgi:hypothetical protein
VAQTNSQGFLYTIRLVIGVLLAATACSLLYLLLGELDNPINGQDEALVLLYSDRLLAGDFAYLDYESVYPFGLGLLLVLPVSLFTDDVLVVRLIPLFLASGLLGVFAFRTHRVLPVLITSVVLLGTWPEGTLYWQYALVLFGLGLQFVLTKHNFSQAVGAILLAFVTSIRLDFAVVILPIIFIHLASMRRYKRREFFPLLFGYLVGLIPLVFQLILIVLGPGIAEWLSIQQTIGRGRVLPIEISSQLSTLMILVGGALISAVCATFARRSSGLPPLFVVAAVCGAAVLAVFQALRRLDAVHLSYALGLCAMASSGLISPVQRVQSSLRTALVGSFLLLIPHLNILEPINGFFRLAPKTGVATTFKESRALCSDVRCLDLEPNLVDWYAEPLRLLSTQPTASVFIGPSDLRTANYSDNWFYLLLENPVCSRFLEMNPGSSNRSDSGLEKDLTDCDYLVLTSLYNMPIENDWALKEFQRSKHNNALSRFAMIYTNNVVSIYANKFTVSS